MLSEKQRLEKCLCANCLREEWANCCACVPGEIEDVSLPEASRTFSSTDEAKEGYSKYGVLMKRLFKEAMGEIFTLNVFRSKSLLSTHLNSKLKKGYLAKCPSQTQATVCTQEGTHCKVSECSCVLQRY